MNIVAKNLSLEINDGTIVIPCELSAKDVFYSHMPLGSLDMYEHYLKAIHIRGVNSTANGFIRLLMNCYASSAYPYSFLSEKIYGSEISHLIVPSLHAPSASGGLFFNDFIPCNRNGGAIRTKIDNASTWTGVLSVDFYFSIDNEYNLTR